ncbi:chromosome segregation protein SMC [Mycoplasmopsis citelli]|uniref:Chromosome segregation protein SMC n=2 Tax=Mycoplasmopsis citelli TaxID=171281 RepID=A0A449B3D0_9BACT|nr:hypothetical protein [Mycoplasmopsis citelli]VEU75071.1 chromosome segregation protein SMC [Mycoplasmopsis citelli]
MKPKTKKILLSSSLGVSVLATGVGIGYLFSSLNYENKISKLKQTISQLNAKLNSLKAQNQNDKTKITTLQAKQQNLETMIKDLQDSKISNSDFSESLNALSQELKSGKTVVEVIKNVGYKDLKTPIMDFKNDLKTKIDLLSTTLKRALESNKNLTNETKDAIKNSLLKAQKFLDNINENNFDDLPKTTVAFNNLSKAQKIYLAQLSTAIDLMNEQIAIHQSEVSSLEKQISLRDQKIKLLSEKLADNLSFYLQLLEEFKTTLNDFDNLKLQSLNTTKVNDLKAKIQITLELIATKKIVFEELLNKMNSSLKQAQADSDYSNVFSYDVDTVQNSFEEVIRNFEQIRLDTISLLMGENNAKTLQILAQQKQIESLTTQSENLQVQVDALTKDKTSLEATIAEIKKDLITNLGSMLDSQISSLTGIETTIRSSTVSEAITLADRLKTQIDALRDIKTKYSADNYTETFSPVVKKALDSAQAVIDEYKSNVLDVLKAQYEQTKASLNKTQSELEITKTELDSKQKELASTQNTLQEVQAQLAQNKKTLETTNELLTKAQTQLNSLNDEIDNNKAQAKISYNAVKEVYDNLKAKATTLLGVAQSGVDLTTLQNQLAQSIPNFDENATLDQMQASIKALIDFSTSLNNAYGDVLQKDYDSQAQKQTQIITSLQASKEQIQRELNSLNSELANNKTQAKSSYEAVKTVYDTLKSKAQNFLSQLDSSVNSDKLTQELAKPIITFDENATLEEQQASIKALIESSTRLNDLYRNTLQQDYDAKAQKQTQTITTLQSSKQQFERELNSLNEKSSQFKSALLINLNKAISDYNAKLNSAKTLVANAKKLSINTEVLENLTQATVLPTNADTPNDQIKLLKQYDERINNLNKESLNIQDLMINKNKENSNKQIENINNQLNQSNQQVSSLRNQLNDVKSRLSAKTEETIQQENQITQLNSELQTQLNQVKELSSKLLNSKTYQRLNNSLFVLSESYKRRISKAQQEYKINHPNQNMSLTDKIDVFVSKENIDYSKSIFDLTPTENQSSLITSPNTQNTLVVKYVDFNDSTTINGKQDYKIKEQIIQYNPNQGVISFLISSNQSKRELFVVSSDSKNHLTYKHYLGIKDINFSNPQGENTQIDFNYSVQILDVKVVVKNQQYVSKIQGRPWELQTLTPLETNNIPNLFNPLIDPNTFLDDSILEEKLSKLPPEKQKPAMDELELLYPNSNIHSPKYARFWNKTKKRWDDANPWPSEKNN